MLCQTISRLSAAARRATALLAILFLAAAPCLAQTVTITADFNSPGPAVNPHMYGIFFEELNHSGDGGLYAEMVRNRSFEDCNVPEGMWVTNGFAVAKCRDRIPWPPKEPVPGWITAPQTGAAGEMTLDTEQPLNDVQLHSLRLNATSANPQASFGVANTGYYGMSFRRGASYRLNLYARAANYQGSLFAVLETRDGRPLSDRVRIESPGSHWKQLNALLKSTGEDHQARLALYLDAPGRVWLDVVSLFPAETWKGRTNGLRPDLAQMLADLKPGFLRFPGGCVTEGLTLEQGFAWKKTIGDIARRPGVWNAMWGYRRTDGFGYHEMLQLCRDIGAAPVYCLNVGIACTIHTQGGGPCPESDVAGYVQDAVDAIAYANDPPTTPMGRLRAANGQPEPFNIRYVNIGNELNCREYTERYPAFYKAIKRAYPDVTSIAYAPVGNPKAPVEMKDVHDYRDDKWFLENMNRFDKYDRSLPKISNMEMAARNRSNHTLHNALLEAAYCLGLERNADVVRLVSYAPLFVNVNSPGPWYPDLIHFDNHRAFGTPSYYAQQLLMHHRPDRVVRTTVETVPEGGVYALAGTTTNDIIVKVVNLASQPRPTTLQLANAPALKPAVTTYTLASENDMDINSFEAPRKISPVQGQLTSTSDALKLTLAPHSFTVLRFEAK